MKKTLKGYIMGFLSAAILLSVVAYAANTATLYNVRVEGVKIVVDGEKLNPTDANGNPVEPIIYNGTTYLPVRAVANAFGKAVYWDGPNYTVYLGTMYGKLEYPTVMLRSLQAISSYKLESSTDLIDNYDNQYGSALKRDWENDREYEYLLDMKYSHFKGTLYVPKGTTSDYEFVMNVEVDGRQVYSSPVMTKTSRPVPFDVNVTGCNEFVIKFSGYLPIRLAEAGLYQ